MPIERIDAGGARSRDARRRASGRGGRAARRRADYGIDELVAGAAPAAPLLVVLDGIEDPHNVGAILRTCDAAGGARRHPAGAACRARSTASSAKASAGAVAHVRIATVVNIARAIEELKAAGVWTIGLAGDATERYDEVDLTLPTALVLGAEGTGLRRLVRETLRPAGRRSRWAGAVDSLNVSVAAGVDAVRGGAAATAGKEMAI